MIDLRKGQGLGAFKLLNEIFKGMLKKSEHSMVLYVVWFFLINLEC